MSGQVAVRVERLSKRYRIGTPDHYQMLREKLTETVSAAWRNMRRPLADSDQHVWALKDVSFEVNCGEAVGIIGRNGAGKSTLLKLLSRITEPTEGRAEVHGRLGSLLEVGTGFHPELTGRENVFLNGAILGMNRREIKRKFDEIVGFAEIERFIDTPVKRYSSGMYLRLAFSVAAHLDLEILAVDEVLAVGDVAFQKKCLGKMEEVRGQQRRTVLFVSHNLGSVKLLTNSCLLIHQGKLLAYGKTDDVVNQYLRMSLPEDRSGRANFSSSEWRNGTSKRPDYHITYQSLRLSNSRGETTHVFFEREPITLSFTVRSHLKARAVEFIVVVLTLEGMVLCTLLSGPQLSTIGEGTFRFSCTMDPNILRPSTYRLRLYIRSGNWQDVIPEAMTFQVEPNPLDHQEMTTAANTPALLGVVRADSAWSDFEPIESEPVVERCHGSGKERVG